MKIVMLDSLTLGAFNPKIFEVLGEFKAFKTTNNTEEVIKKANDADIIITNKAVIDSKAIQSLNNLKLICVAATGTNNIDLIAAQQKGVQVKNVVGYSTYAVAQHTFALALSLLGKLPYYTEYVKNGSWIKSEIFCHIHYEIIDIYNKEWGIIGFGNIGKQVCNIAKSFGAKVSYYSTSGKNNDNTIPQKSLESLLATSDIISIHSPLNDKTYNLIKENELRRLKNGAILLNLGRGGIINEEDLAKRLEEQDFYFGADVLEKEPMIPNHPLLNPKIAHKIILTPHIAWAYKDTKDRLLELVAKNIKDFLEKTTKS